MSTYKNSDEYWQDMKDKWSEHDSKERCQFCGKMVYDIFEAELDGKTKWICEDCSDKEFIACKVCGVYFHPDYTYTNEHCDKHTPKMIRFKVDLGNMLYRAKRRITNGIRK